jgi:hypothetical protein
VSMAISLSSFTDGPPVGVFNDPTFGTRCRGAVHTNTSLLISTTKDVDGAPAHAMTWYHRRQVNH